MVGEIIEDNTPKFEKGGEVKGKTKQSKLISKGCIKGIETILACLLDTRYVYVGLLTQAYLDKSEGQQERWCKLLDGTDTLITRYKEFLKAFDAYTPIEDNGYEFKRYKERQDGLDAAIGAETKCLEACVVLMQKADSNKDYITSSLGMSTLRIHTRCVGKLKQL